MSFNIWANGRSHFHYGKENVIDGSEFDTMQNLTILQGMQFTKASLLDGALQKYASKGVADGATSVATREMLNLLVSSVDVLAMSARGTGSSINVRSTQRKSMWADASRFASYDFSPGDNPGVEFYRTISRSLVETDMANWGVLMALAIVLTKYSAHLSSNTATPWITIELTNNTMY